MTDEDIRRGKELLAWGRQIDAEIVAESRGDTPANRRKAKDLIELAMVEADKPQPRGGHRHGARRPLTTWEAEAELHNAELVLAALQGRLTKRTGALRHGLGLALSA